MPELALHVPQRPRSLLRSRSAAAGRVVPAPAAVAALVPVPALALAAIPALAPVPAKASVATPSRSNGAHGTNGKSGAAHEAKVAKASVEDWLRIPEEKRAELIHGQIVYHAFPG